VGTEYADVTARLIDSLRASAVLAGVYAAYCLTLPHTPPRRKADEPWAFLKAFKLLRHRSFAILMVASLLVACIHKIFFIQTSPLLSSLGMRDSDIMPAMSVGQIAEIFMILILGLMLKNLGFRAVMTIGASAYILRFLFFGSTFLPLWAIVASMSLHGVGFACFYAAAFIYIDRLAEPDVRHSAQTLYGLLLGIGPFIGGWLNGLLAWLFTPEGGKLNYMGFWYSVAAIGLVATIVIATLFRDETKQKD
jgi:predicted MFS family arabinose efflux permease